MKYKNIDIIYNEGVYPTNPNTIKVEVLQVEGTPRPNFFNVTWVDKLGVTRMSRDFDFKLEANGFARVLREETTKYVNSGDYKRTIKIGGVSFAKNGKYKPISGNVRYELLKKAYRKEDLGKYTLYTFSGGWHEITWDDIDWKGIDGG